MTLSNTSAIPGLHANIFGMRRALQKGFQVMSEGETLILNKKSTGFCFDDKMAKISGKGFQLITKFHKSTNDVYLLPPQEAEAGREVIRTSGRDLRKETIK